MKCHACETDLSKKEAVYTENKLPYCPNPMTCNEEHPNSVKNIVKRAGAVKMFSEYELNASIYERLNVPQETKDRIMKIATKPQSIRLAKVDVAHYVLALQEAKGFSSISEAVRYCIEEMMKIEPIDAAMEKLPVPEPIEDEPSELEPEPPFERFLVDNPVSIENIERDPITNPVPIEEIEPEPVVKKAKVTIIPKVKDLIMNQIDKQEEKEEKQEEKFVF